MNKLFTYISFLIGIMMVSCNTPVKVESGVSFELARERKTNVSNVSYDLSFSIDSAETVNPEGKIAISFEYTPDGNPLIIDFEGDHLKCISVNGKDVEDPEWKDGHIIVKPEYLKKGHNIVCAGFTAAGRALNRNPGYMYTLFVPNRAHSVFPCFDQPDMKASYNLTLTVPRRWKAVSNSPVMSTTVDDPR
ncbi:MAG: aminopeptidase, partial [Muribaculaceae bacterium]|nr:aminopeptidase [Muribaculaceae bacterium]